MWTCPHCGEQIDENFDSCRKCGTGKDGTPPEDPKVYAGAPGEFQERAEELDSATPPCPLCGGETFAWGSLHGHGPLTYQGPGASPPGVFLGLGGRGVDARLCETCGNLQLFARG